MALLFTDNKEELIMTCKCGCGDCIHIRIDKEDDDYAVMTYLNGNWYRDQESSVIKVIGCKLKKIWAIIRNKDYFYSEIIMNKKDFHNFKEYINKI